MNQIIRILILIFLLFIPSCSKKDQKISTIEETDMELQMIDSYRQAVEALDKGDALLAAKKFNEAELLYPQSEVRLNMFQWILRTSSTFSSILKDLILG